MIRRTKLQKLCKIGYLKSSQLVVIKEKDDIIVTNAHWALIADESDYKGKNECMKLDKNVELELQNLIDQKLFFGVSKKLNECEREKYLEVCKLLRNRKGRQSNLKMVDDLFFFVHDARDGQDCFVVTNNRIECVLDRAYLDAWFDMVGVGLLGVESCMQIEMGPEKTDAVVFKYKGLLFALKPRRGEL
jgi:hypothetical protein